MVYWEITWWEGGFTGINWERDSLSFRTPDGPKSVLKYRANTFALVRQPVHTICTLYELEEELESDAAVGELPIGIFNI